MKIVFGDAFYFVALLSRRDSRHQRAVEFSQSFDGTIVTTCWILTEVANTFRRPVDRPLFRELLGLFEEVEQLRVLPVAERQFEQGVALFTNRPDKFWSLTDCISFVVMEELQIREALTGDHHFAQAGFVPLLTGN